MRTIKLFIMFVCVFAASTLAESQSPTTPQRPKSKDIHFTLSKQTDIKSLRAPSLNPSSPIVGTYNEEGMFNVALLEDSAWEMVIEGVDGETDTYFVSTSDLQKGVYIGVMAGFSVTITNDSGLTYYGEIYL